MEWVNGIMGTSLCECTEVGNINVPSLLWSETFTNMNYYVIASTNKWYTLTPRVEIMENIVNSGFKFVVLDVTTIYMRQ
jgi:hypothetical protein